MDQTFPRPRSLRLMLLLIATASLQFSSRSALAQTADQLSARTLGQMEVLLLEKAARSPAQKKMDSQLVFAARAKRDGMAHKDVPKLRVALESAPDGRTKVDIDATVSGNLLAAIAAAGGEIINSVPEEHALRALLQIENIEQLAAREDVRIIRPASIAYTNAGKVTSQGDVTHRSNVARSSFGANGAGVTVGILSDSIDDNKGSFSAAIKSGDINGNNTFSLQGQAGQGEGEGLAMMEIVHDLAPAAKLIFATGSSTAAQMAKNIRSLAAHGCQVIIDDISYPDESPFQDGVIAKAVNDVSAAGVLYFSSAANSGNKQSNNSGTWEGDFVKGGANIWGEYHAFKNGVVADMVTEESGNRAVLYWSDPLGASTNDYDLFVYDSFGDIVSVSTNPQEGTQDPIESVPPPRKGEYLVIYKVIGQSRYLHLDTNRARLAVGTPGSTKGHNASGAPNAFCVAAAPAAAGQGQGPNGPFPNAFSSTSKVEDFSSDGFRRIFFYPNGSPITPGNFSSTGGKLLLKPDLTAADGVATTLPLNGGLNPFFGTSAAAPHAGAIAAQVLSRRLNATPKQVRAALNASAIDILTVGADRASGRGIIMAPRAVQTIATSAEAPPADNGEDGRGHAASATGVETNGISSP